MENMMLNTSQHTSGTTTRFPLEYLKKITNNFSNDRIIGSGTYGVVYKGVLDKGEKIAVKKLRNMSQDFDGEKQFLNECTNLIMVQHQNIVRLVGYCYETCRQLEEYGGKHVFAEVNERALCFEYMEGGSLENYVSDKPCALAWDICYKIIKGVSEGLNHLHNGCKYIIHLDLKPANILLDEDMIPKIGDFGLSRLFSSPKTCTTTTCLGTLGFTPPEHIDNHKISPKYDVFSLGVVIIYIMAGSKQYNDHSDNPSQIIKFVSEHWEKSLDATIWAHASKEVNTCIEIALRCVKSDRHERPTISQIVEDLNTIDMAKMSLTYEGANLQRREALDYNSNSILMGVRDNATRFDSMEGIDYITAVSNEGGDNDNSTHHPMDYLHESIIRTEGNIHSPITMDTIGNLFQWARSNIPSQWSVGTQEKALHDELFSLENGLQCLTETLPAMYDLIDRAEWRRHKPRVAELLPNLKDAVYDADDLIDEFRWYVLKVKVEQNGSQSPSMDFFNNVIQGSFTKLVNSSRDRLHNISTLLQNMGIHEVTRFDKSVRPETSSFPDETRIVGRDMELNKILEILCKPTNSSNDNPKYKKENSAVYVSKSTSASNQVSTESSITDLTVLPIVGIGGVGKTTLAQHICSNAQVKSHFDLIIWVCVSDDFDVKRLTKEAIESCPGKVATTENLNSLQNVLSGIVSSKKFLIVLDDMWDDVLKENGLCWKRFCAPLKNVIQGSVMLVTTRCHKVAQRVGTRDPITLKGLKDDVFWNFFKLCVFESRSSNNNDPELERIGRSIVPKLKGSPLAAKTIGRILRINFQAEYWNDILQSELWKLKQEETEILPALQLSYIYLPYHLKRCFSLCAVYPKDYKFKKGYLAEIWVAEGFVEPQGDIPVQVTGCEYFHELLYRSFFQEVQGEYVIHDLLHDMAQKVSEFDCFIVKTRSDFKGIPRNVRHLSILSSRDIDYSSLLGLCHFTKLRTLICNKSLVNKGTPASLMAAWCNELRRLRVIVFGSTHELPANIGNLKHLRYIRNPRIHGSYSYKSLPAEFYWLYNLQIVCLPFCELESLPTDFNKLICLLRFESDGFRCDSRSRRFQENEFSLEFQRYQGLSFQSWFQPQNLASLESPSLISGDILEKSPVRRITDLIIDGCENLSSLEHVIHTAYISVLKKLKIKNCKKLVSVPTERFGSLEELVVHGCPNINSRSLVAPSLKRLVLGTKEDDQSRFSKENDQSQDRTCGYLANNFDCCSLTYFFLSSNYLISIQLQKWNLPALEELCISQCRNLRSVIGQSGRVIRGVRTFPSLTSLTIDGCHMLRSIDDFLVKEYLPIIQRIRIRNSDSLVSLPCERFVNFSFLKELEISCCYRLCWRERFVLPSSLQILSLSYCGDISEWFPRCLKKLSSLVTLKIRECWSIKYIEGNLWSTNLTSLEDLMIRSCENIVTIGGENAISEIKNVSIDKCPKLEEINQPMLSGSYVE